MRTRLVTLLSAVLLVVMAMPAFAAYPPAGDCSAANKGLNVAVDLNATETTEGLVSAAVCGLQANSGVTLTMEFPGIQSGALSSTSVAPSDARAIAFVGAQAATYTVVISGNADAAGAFAGSAPIPAGADSTGAFSVTLVGIAADGSIVNNASVVNAPAPGPLPATGTESGLLAVIALGLVGAGAGAVVMTRRRSRIEA